MAIQTIVGGLIVGIVLAIVGAYIYRRNKTWERRGETYTEILEALSDFTTLLKSLLADQPPAPGEPDQSLLRVSQLLKSRLSLVEEDVRDAMHEYNDEMTKINAQSVTPKENVQAVLDVTYRLHSVFSEAQERHTR